MPNEFRKTNMIFKATTSCFRWKWGSFRMGSEFQGREVGIMKCLKLMYTNQSLIWGEKRCPMTMKQMKTTLLTATPPPGLQFCIFWWPGTDHTDLLVIFSTRNCVFTTTGWLLWDGQGHKWRKMVMLTSGLSLIIRKPRPTVGCLCRKTRKTASPDRRFPAGPAPVWSYSLQCIGWDRLVTWTQQP